jgi:5-(carboxyamino)imidazole ribonucleotide synthase
VLKTAAFGYDGKGQFRIQSPDQIEEGWNAIGRQEAVLEAFIDFDRELSVVAARGMHGDFVHYGAFENQHSRHILDVSIAPARVPLEVAREAVELARTVLEELDVIGVLCVEFFLTRDGKLLINELAPRPHNSGHLTVDAHVTSQFEQQLRAVCGLPLGSTEMHRPAAMANILGDLWSSGEPNWPAACAFPDVKLHLYGKLEARPGRKMGHLTALNHDPEEAYRTVVAARKRLTS